MEIKLYSPNAFMDFQILIEFANFWLPSLPFLDILNWGKTFKNQWFRENSLINSLTVFLTPNDHPHWNTYCKQNHASNHFPFASRCVHFSKSLTVRCPVQYFLFMRGDFLPIPQFFYTDLCNFCVILLKKKKKVDALIIHGTIVRILSLRL